MGAPRIGQTVRGMLENGKMIKRMVTEYCTIPMATSMKGSGLMTRPTGKESILTPMGLDTAVDGLTISSMDTAVKLGKTVQHMRANITLERKTEKAN